MQNVFQVSRYRTLAAAIGVVSLALAAGTVTAGEVRQWTYSQPGGGREVEFEADFVGLKGITVVLKSADGKNYEPPLASLSEEDVQYVEKMSRTDQGEFVDWTDALGNELKVRYAGIAGETVILATKEGGKFSVPFRALKESQKVYVLEAQQAAAAAKALEARAAQGWKRLENGFEVATLNPGEPENEGEFERFLFSPNGALLFSKWRASRGDNPEVLRIWNVDKLRQQCTLPLPDDGYGEPYFFFGPASRELWYWLNDEVVRWDASTGRVVFKQDNRTFQTVRSVIGYCPQCACYSPNGKILAVGFDSRGAADERGIQQPVVSLLDVAAFQHLEGLIIDDVATNIERLLFSEDGMTLVGLTPFGDFHAWNLVTKSHRHFSRDSTLVGVVNGGVVVVRSGDDIRSVGLNAGADEQVFNLPGAKDGGYVKTVVVSPIGQVVAVATGSTVHLHNWSTDKSLGTLPTDGRSVRMMQFSPDGTLLATGDAHGRVKLWKLTGLVNNENKPDPAAATEPAQRHKPPVVLRQLFDGRTLNRTFRTSHHEYLVNF